MTIRGGGTPYSNLALDADRENGPAARSFAADAHDRIMVRINRSYRIQVCDTKMHPMASSPRILIDAGRPPEPEGRAISKYGNGEAIFAQGDPADAVFYVQAGQVK